MKLIPFFLQLLVSVQVLVFPTILTAQTHHTTDHPGIHGMVLFGAAEQYVSHLPLFHTPHDYQVILKIELDPSEKNAYFEDIKTHIDELYTIEPEKFVLPEILNEIHSFKANIYRGHFERGGKLILQDVNVHIKKVLYFNKLNVEKNQDNPFQYMLFGNNEEQFLVHQIENRPDFDEILRVKVLDKKTRSKLLGDRVIAIPLDSKEVKPYHWDFTKSTNIDSVKMTVLKRIYLEFDDLK